MATIIMDTYDYAAKLKASGFTEEQAAGQTKALAEILEKQMASKAEVEEQDSLLKRDIAQINADLKRDIEQAKIELKRDIKESELKLEAKIAESKTDTIKWLIGLLIAQSGLIIGVMMKLMPP